jgi:hypothetical protein
MDDVASSQVEERAVLATLQALLDAIADRDHDAMRATLMPDGGATHARGDTVTHARLSDLPDRIKAGPERLEERIHDPLVRIDHDIAMAWAPYDFLIDGEVHHWGTNIVSFLKVDGRWLISGIADNGHTGPKP